MKESNRFSELQGRMGKLRENFPNRKLNRFTKKWFDLLALFF